MKDHSLTDFFTRLGRPFAARDDAQGNRRAIVAGIIIVVASLVYFLTYW
jgi:hypothetical protein